MCLILKYLAGIISSLVRRQDGHQLLEGGELPLRYIELHCFVTRDIYVAYIVRRLEYESEISFIGFIGICHQSGNEVHLELYENGNCAVCSIFSCFSNASLRFHVAMISCAVLLPT